MKPLKVKFWVVETRAIYPSGIDGWSRRLEPSHATEKLAQAWKEEKIACGEKREMRIVAIDFRGRVIPPERLPPETGAGSA